MNDFKYHQRLKTRTYNIWKGIRVRCYNKNHHTYKNYGGRGICICKRWDSFELFFKDMGECPIGYSIDRINNNGNYSPENCRWSNKLEQSKNTRKNVFLTFNGKTQTISDWAKELNLDQDLISERIRKLKWSTKDALTKPIRKIKGIHY